MGGRRKSIDLFRLSVPIIVAVAALGILAPKQLSQSAGRITESAFESIDWFFMSTATGLLVLCAWLAFGPYKDLRLGKEGEEPDFSTSSWLAMLFAAGMGVGILFWGVAEPITHFTSAPGAEPGSAAAARRAMVLSGFHWGLHAWAIYCAAALVLAIFAFRRGRPYLPGEPLRDIFRGRWVAPLAKAADLLAVLAIVFGVAASLTMGIFQLQAGLHITFGLPIDSISLAVVILVILVISYMTSAATSLDKGIKWLSNTNMVLALALLAFVLVTGPSEYILKSFVTSIGDYSSRLIGLSLRLYPYESSEGWVHGWTLTYLIWWIAWAPFVGVFIARISRGRTIREFILGVVLVPTVFTMFWFSILGGTALFEEIHGSGGISEVVSSDVTLALFAMFEHLPGSGVLAFVALLLIFVFLVTSVDSATFVLGMLSSNGDLDPPRNRKLTWGIAVGVFAGALLLNRSVEVVRSVAILGAIPFAFILLLQVVAMLKALRQERETHDGGAQEKGGQK